MLSQLPSPKNRACRDEVAKVALKSKKRRACRGEMAEIAFKLKVEMPSDFRIHITGKALDVRKAVVGFASKAAIDKVVDDIVEDNHVLSAECECSLWKASELLRDPSKAPMLFGL